MKSHIMPELFTPILPVVKVQKTGKLLRMGLAAKPGGAAPASFLRNDFHWMRRDLLAGVGSPVLFPLNLLF
jgi:hypothetical protein